MKCEELLGMRIGKLKLNRIDTEKSVNGRWYINCECECGNTKSVRYDHLKSKKVLSCGCVRKLKSKESIVKLSTSHNMSKTSFYKRWSSMKERCCLKSNKNYKRYIDANIKVCDEWLIFSNFYNDMYESFLEHSLIYGEENTTLDRINNSLGYEFLNCRWATYTVQANNRSNNKNVREVDNE